MCFTFNYPCRRHHYTQHCANVQKAAKEAKEKWGDTAAYKESAEKTADYSADKWKQINSAMYEIISEFADCKGKGFAPENPEAQALAKNGRILSPRITTPVPKKFF